MIDIEQAQQEILQSDQLSRLYEIQIELSKLIKNAHHQNLTADTIMEQSEAKGNLGIYHSMLDILQNRVQELKEIAKDERNEQGRLNYNFRMAARNVLEKKTYQAIMDLAMQTRREVKEQSKELRQNKLQ